jgi:hypothetical protein
MTEGYLANNKKTPQDVTIVEVILFNHLMQERWKEQTEQWKEQNRAKERILFPLKWHTKGSTT